MIRITDHPNMSSAVCCECYRKNQTNKAILGEKKSILMLILLEINAFIKNPTFLPCQVGNTLFSQNFFVVFVGMAIFHIFLILEERISVESLVKNQKSRLIFIQFFQKIIAL